VAPPTKHAHARPPAYTRACSRPHPRTRGGAVTIDFCGPRHFGARLKPIKVLSRYNIPKSEAGGDPGRNAGGG
jgi:hypothetical protein